jgi:uncharacterized membrane protein YedE/YeeE
MSVRPAVAAIGPPRLPPRDILTRGLLPALIVLGIGYAAWRLHGQPGPGRDPAFTVLAGAAFGILLQRARFCFFCNLRDLIEGRGSQGVLGILAALAVGSIGYLVLFGAWVAEPGAGRLPPDAHIGPVSWVLVAAGLSFGLGMTLSGSCISAHLYRLGEGSLLAPVALAGAVAGFALGFLTWQPLYIVAISKAPVVWLPAQIGYAGAALLQGAVLLGLTLLLLGRLAPAPARPDRPPALRDLAHRILVERWPAWLGGLGVGFLGVLAYFRTEPLGVTAELGSRARTLAEQQGWISGRLPGLDGFSGCATEVIESALTSNGLFVLALVAASLAAALAAGQFQPQRVAWQRVPLALAGGVLMGWGAMVGLGCTVGTLLSGISAFALSGWVFAAAVVAAVWASLALQRRVVGGGG